MKRVILIAVSIVALTALAACNSSILGTDHSSKPVITRIFVAPSCGVAPMQVEVYGVASGGNESGDPTGGNNNLTFTWNFGDGATSATSIAYHTYAQPGDYAVTLRVEDPDGNSAERTLPLVVVADSLDVQAMSDAVGAVTTADTVQFDYRAGTCGVDPNSLSDRASYLEQTWYMNDPGFPDGGVYEGPEPRHRFSAPGTYQVVLRCTYVGWAVTRRDTLEITVN